MNINRFNPEQRAMMCNEIQILKKLDHTYIVKLFEYFKDDERFYMIMELIAGGELY